MPSSGLASRIKSKLTLHRRNSTSGTSSSSSTGRLVEEDGEIDALSRQSGSQHSSLSGGQQQGPAQGSRPRPVSYMEGGRKRTAVSMSTLPPYLAAKMSAFASSRELATSAKQKQKQTEVRQQQEQQLEEQPPSLAKPRPKPTLGLVYAGAVSGAVSGSGSSPSQQAQATASQASHAPDASDASDNAKSVAKSVAKSGGKPDENPASAGAKTNPSPGTAGGSAVPALSVPTGGATATTGSSPTTPGAAPGAAPSADIPAVQLESIGDEKADTDTANELLPAPSPPSSGTRSAPPAHLAPATPTKPATTRTESSDSNILHHQRLQLQDRLKRIALGQVQSASQSPTHDHGHGQDPLYYNPAILPPSPTSRDRDRESNTSPTATSPLQSIHEHVSLDPQPKLRPPSRYADDAGQSSAASYHDVHHHSPTTFAPSASSHPPAATASTSASSPSARDRARDRISSSSAAASASASAPATPRRPLAAQRRSSGSGPALRQTSTPREAHFVDEPAREFAAPSPPAMTGARKIWVARPGASPTLITIGEDDLVDDVRDIILRKYANSLGKTFDAPDLVLRIRPRDQKERLLAPDEHMCRTLESFYPGGQTVDDYVVIDIPRRTPKPSPHQQGGQHHGGHHLQQQIPHTAAAIYYADDARPLETGEGYFPPVGGLPSPHMQLVMPPGDRHGGQPHSIAVLGTGHLPTIPSPGGLRPRAHREQGRPRIGRTHTSSSGINGRERDRERDQHRDHAAHGMHQHRPRLTHSRTHSSSSDPSGMPPGVVPMSIASMPKSPGHDHIHPAARVNTPPARMAEPRSSSVRPKRRQKNIDPSSSSGIVAVPPISVLIVEDNPINLKLLEAFVKRLKVRWQTATNGRDAVKKWRTGGFHLVLMDIQLPVMNGLEATREIRRLERVNSIGVFSSVPSTPKEELAMELQDKDRLDNLDLFKGPVIIVALTASSLQSDRHEALAAGCNDFLTKPVNFVWLERKVMEWGCMQALIDFDGWRTWKDFALAEEEASQKAAAARIKAKKARSSLATEV